MMILDPSKSLDMVIRTERLTLRLPVYADAKSLHDMLSSREITHFSPHRPVKDVALTHFIIVEWHEARSRGLRSFVITRSDRRHEPIGLLQVDRSEELGGFIAPSFGRHGYAREALFGVIEALSLVKAWTITDAEHTTLIRTLIKCNINPVERLPNYRVHPQISSQKRDCLRMRQG